MAKKYILDGVNYGRDLDTYISKNFQYWEFVSSYEAVRLGIKNVPTNAEWKNIEDLVVNVLQPMRDKLGKPVTVNSGFRCKELNDAVGSSDTSFHRLGCAADIDSDTIPLMDILDAVYSLPKWTEIIAEYFPHGWVHVAYKLGDKRKMLKLKDADHHYKGVSKEYLDKIYGGK